MCSFRISFETLKDETVISFYRFTILSIIPSSRSRLIPRTQRYDIVTMRPYKCRLESSPRTLSSRFLVFLTFSLLLGIIAGNPLFSVLLFLILHNSHLSSRLFFTPYIRTNQLQAKVRFTLILILRHIEIKRKKKNMVCVWCNEVRSSNFSFLFFAIIDLYLVSSELIIM